MTPFLGSKSKKNLSGAGFGPKPTSVPNFIKIGVGDRNLVLTSPIFGLLNLLHFFRLSGLTPHRHRVDDSIHHLLQPAQLVSMIGWIQVRVNGWHWLHSQNKCIRLELLFKECFIFSSLSRHRAKIVGEVHYEWPLKLARKGEGWGARRAWTFLG